VKEQFNQRSLNNSAEKNHLFCCDVFCKPDYLNSFKILRKCLSEFNAKIHEALLIKKHNPQLNKKLYGRGASVLLKVF